MGHDMGLNGLPKDHRIAEPETIQNTHNVSKNCPRRKSFSM